PAKGVIAADCVVVSGWQVYDNKGRVVEKYEPFFSTGWEFATALDNQMGPRITMQYDPRGQVIRTVNPDHTEQRVLFGVPRTLEAPAEFEPTPWENYTYDACDLGTIATSTALTTIPANASHLFTPASQLIDALGRTRCAIQRNGKSPDG